MACRARPERRSLDNLRPARRQPWAVVGAGLFLGFAASRLLKASSTDRYHASQTQRIEPQARPTPARFERPAEL